MSQMKIIHLFTLRKQFTLFQQRKSLQWKVDCCDNGMWYAWMKPTPQSINPTTWKCNLIQSAVNLGIDASANGWQSVISETKFANFEWLHQLVDHYTEKQMHLHQIKLQNGLLLNWMGFLKSSCYKQSNTWSGGPSLPSDSYKQDTTESKLGWMCVVFPFQSSSPSSDHKEGTTPASKCLRWIYVVVGVVVFLFNHCHPTITRKTQTHRANVSDGRCFPVPPSS